MVIVAMKAVGASTAVRNQAIEQYQKFIGLLFGACDAIPAVLASEVMAW
jgi:hypothetical protein